VTVLVVGFPDRHPLSVIGVPVSLVCLNASALTETRSHRLNPNPLASLSTPDVAALEEQGGSSAQSAAVRSGSGSKNDGSSTSFSAMEGKYGISIGPVVSTDDTNGDERSATGLLEAISVIDAL
jgi:hypothetical protein